MARRKLKDNEIVVTAILERELWDRVGEVAKCNKTTKQEIMKQALDFFNKMKLQEN